MLTDSRAEAGEEEAVKHPHGKFLPGKVAGFEQFNYCQRCHYEENYLARSGEGCVKPRSRNRITDKMRLDWLQGAKIQCPFDEFKTYIVFKNGYTAENRKLRDAVDSAILATRRKGSK